MKKTIKIAIKERAVPQKNKFIFFNFLCNSSLEGSRQSPSVNYSADRARYSEWRTELGRYLPLYFDFHCISTSAFVRISSTLPLYICDIIWRVPSHSLCEDRDVDTILLPNQSRGVAADEQTAFFVSLMNKRPFFKMDFQKQFPGQFPAYCRQRLYTVSSEPPGLNPPKN